jgi:hypothetical protein
MNIAAVFKQRLRLARSSSSPLLFMSHDGVGAGLPSVRDMRDVLLVETAHHITANGDLVAAKVEKCRKNWSTVDT